MHHLTQLRECHISCLKLMMQFDEQAHRELGIVLEMQKPLVVFSKGAAVDGHRRTFGVEYPCAVLQHEHVLVNEHVPARTNAP